MPVQKELKNWYIWEYVEPRTPWANTLAYYPLNWDLNDYSWNSRNLTADGTPIYTTLGEKQVASFDGTWEGGYLNNNLLKGLQPFTYVVWVNPSSITSWMSEGAFNCNIVMTIRNGADTGIYDKALLLQETNKATAYNYYNWRITPSLSWVSTNTWQMLTAVFDWSTLTTYINTNSTSLSCWWSYTGYSNATMIIGSKVAWWHIFPYYWLMSSVIVENKVRTAEEIQNYYNQTKSNYWL